MQMMVLNQFAVNLNKESAPMAFLFRGKWVGEYASFLTQSSAKSSLGMVLVADMGVRAVTTFTQHYAETVLGFVNVSTKNVHLYI